MSSKTTQKGTKVLRERSVSESKDGNCVLCCGKAKFFAVGNCDHPICYKCSARMRVLSKQNYCAACRAQMDQVIFCRKIQTFEEFDLKKLSAKRQHGIRFEDKDLKDAFEMLLDYICNECGEKERPFGSLQELKAHIRKVHEKQFCQICIDNLSIFPSEFKVYTKKELVTHRREGDKDEKSHRGHPDCKFCDDRFFDNDSLLLHLRKNHFWCHFCEHDGKQDYYDMYKQLRQHFENAHYLCDEGNCFNEKFTSVYRDKIDYQAHKLAAHGKKLSKVQAREARKVDIDYSFGRRQPKSNVVSGADYEEVQREDAQTSGRDNRRGGGSYHRDKRGKLNFYDYEDIKQDRKEFLGRVHRHEAEEVQNRNTTQLIGLAASVALSSSEPNIHNRVHSYMKDSDDDEDLVDIPKHSNTKEKRTTPKEKEKNIKKEEKRKTEIEAPVAIERVRASAKPQTQPPTKPQTKENVPKNNVPPPPPVMDRTEDDFPTLPGSSAKPFSNVSKSLTRDEAFPVLGNPAKVHQPTRKGLSAADAAKSGQVKSKPVHINGIPIVKAKKKGKGKLQQTNKNNDDFPTLDSTSSKQSSVQETKINHQQSPNEFKLVTSKKSEQAISNKKIPPGLQSTTQKSKTKDVTGNNNDFPTLGQSSKQISVQETKINHQQSPNEFKLVTSKKSEQAISNKKVPPGLQSTTQKSKTKDVTGNNDDFPTLGKSSKQSSGQETKKTHQPPGLHSSTHQNGYPPGLNKNTFLKEPTNAPPPGLVKKETQLAAADSKKSPPGIKDNTADKNKMERNQRLLAMLQAYLTETGLMSFKTISGEFRRGLKKGDEYYRDISELLGDNLKYVFSELVALLPDENKQQELLFAHNNAKVIAKQMKEAMVNAPPPDYTSKSTWGAHSDKSNDKTNDVIVTRCGDCGQTFPKDKALEHMNSHSEKFPSLPTAVKKKKTYSFAPMSKMQTIPARNAWGGNQ